MSTPTPRTGSALPQLSRRGWVLAIAGIVALTAVVAAYAWVTESKPVRWKDVGFTVTSPTQAVATFDVYLYTDASATCTVRALNSRFTEVGVATTTIDRAAGAEQRLSVTLTTTEEATTATVVGCVAAP